MKIVFEPKEEYIEQISTWLLDEKNKGINSFYNTFINSNFNNDNFMCLLDNNEQVIGYFDYCFSDKVAKINVAVIKNSERNKGNGRMLLNSFKERCKDFEVAIINLDCEPSSSKKIWKKLGFKEFKEIEEHKFLKFKNHQMPWLYCILVETEKTTRKKNLDSFIEVSAFCEHTDRKQKNIYKWNLENISKPIIYPVDGEWKIKYVLKKEIISEVCLKHFFKGKYLEDNFLYLTEISD